MTNYVYSLPLDAPEGGIEPARLLDIVRKSAISVQLVTISIDPVAGTFTLVFAAPLSPSDQNLLDGGSGLPHGTHPAGGLIALADNSPPSNPVRVVNSLSVAIQQQQKSNGHYRVVPLTLLAIGSGATKYNDFVVQDYPKGLDWHNAHFYAGDSDSGDQIVMAKLLIGKIAALAAPATQGDTIVTLAGPASILKPTAQGGVIDEGFFLSFGTEASSAAAVNSVAGGPPGTGTLSNPETELREYEIYSIGTVTPIGSGNVSVPVTLFAALAAGLAGGLDANLTIRAVPDPIPITKNDTINIGGDVLTAGNMPAGSKLRYGYQNNGQATKNIRAYLTTLY